MSEIKIYENHAFGEIRTVLMDGEPWFVAADVCRVLEHSNVSMALERLDDDEKAKFSLGLSGGDTNAINEPGLYSLVLGSRKPEAKAFKRWVTHEVLPAIRMHGGYVTPRGIEAMLLQPDMLDKLAKAIRNRNAEVRRLPPPSDETKQEAIRQGVAGLLATGAVISRVGDVVMLERQPVYNMLAHAGFGPYLGLKALDALYPLRRDSLGRRTVQKKRNGVVSRVIVLTLCEKGLRKEANHA